MDDYGTKSISFGTFKESLLYYDYIIPIFFRTKEFDGIKDCSVGIKQSQLDNLFDDIFPQKHFFDGAKNRKELIDAVLEYTVKVDFFKVYSRKEVEVIYRKLSKMVQQSGMTRVHVNCRPELISDSKKKKEQSIKIVDLRLVDVDSTSIEHLLEFRKDKNSRRKMHAFRHFVLETYKDKSKEHIEDDIQKKLEEYNLAVKKWGFETVEKNLTFLLNSKSLLGTLATTFAGLYFGQKETAMIGTAGSLTVAVGNVSLIIGKQILAYRELINANPVSYIADAKKKLERPVDGGLTTIW